MSFLAAKRFGAILFDLDGVITDTALVHARCWKRMFDAFLAEQPGGMAPFDGVDDYRRYVDGKPRYKGVASFLTSRQIELPYGDPDDPPGHDSICALGNRKNALIQEVLKEEGVVVYPGSLKLLDWLRDRAMPLAIVSSSRNCQAVLQVAGLEDRFLTRVDGVVSAELGLSGKPEPDIFLEAAQRLGVLPDQAVVVEDAISGVQAGRAGGFGLVVGVDRHDQAEDLRANGADLVVEDLADLI